MSKIVNTGKTYKTYKNLPPLAGIGTISETIEKSLSVEECSNRFKRFHYSLQRLYEIFISQIASEPIYELKMAFSLHSHYCAEHISAIRNRVSEMREPPLGLDQVPHPTLEIFFDEILKCSTTSERLVALYEITLPALIQGIKDHQNETNPLADHPSVRVLRFALFELEEMQRYGTEAISCLVSEEEKTQMKPWTQLLQTLLTQSGKLDGTQTDSIDPDFTPNPIYSQKDFVYDKTPQRDERFIDPYNAGVNAETFLHTPEFDPSSKVPMMFYKRIREIDVPEMMASILFETKEKTWEYYRSMTRQLWDEARHAMMGEVGFISLDIDWTKIPINFTWSLSLNQQLKPFERHAILYFIEQGLMPKNGKRYEWEVGVSSQNPLAELFQDYDWADEVLHAKVGREWYVPEFENTKKATQYGDECWSKVLMNWSKWKDDGLTEHHNWWPDLYESYCQKQGEKPNAQALEFSDTYENTRADLQSIAV